LPPGAKLDVMEKLLQGKMAVLNILEVLNIKYASEVKKD
jgi:hypothetical protein